MFSLNHDKCIIYNLQGECIMIMALLFGGYYVFIYLCMRINKILSHNK